MDDKEILKKVHKMTKILNDSPSTFMQEYDVDYNRADEETIEEQTDILVDIIERELDGYKLTPEIVSRIIENEQDEQCKALLVAATRDNKFIKEYIRNNNIRQKFKNRLAIFTGEKAFIEECIDTSGNKTIAKIELIEQMGTDYIKRYLKNSQKENMTLFNRIYLVCATHDSEYIQKFMKEIPPVSEEYILELIIATRDENYIIKCLREKKINDVYRLIALKELIKLSGKSKQTKAYINEIRKELDIEGKVALLMILGGIEDLGFNINDDSKTQKVPNITLPPQITIGIEIESVGKYAQILHNSKIFGWQSKEDSSLKDDSNERNNGIEVVSPILTNDGNVENEIQKICAILSALGQKTNQSCGAHVHIGADYLSNGESLKNFLYLIENTEDFLYILSNEDGTIPRNKIMFYAEPFTLKLSDELEDGSININDEQDLESITNEIHKVHREDRYIVFLFNPKL